MTIDSIYAYLLHPGKNVEKPIDIVGSKLTPTGSLFELVDGIFSADADQRDIDVAFNPDKDGNQNNVCRSLILKHYQDPSRDNGYAIAQRLQSVTDGRSGLGLLFIMSGTWGLKQKFVISRFPADTAILAEIEANSLTVEVLDKVFVKRMTAYKAILLEHENPMTGFWIGKATDRQVSGSESEISNYWIKDFLDAGFIETPAAGTRRLAGVLRKVVSASPNMNMKAEIASATSLAGGALNGKQMTIAKFCDHFGLSSEAKSAVETQTKSNAMLHQTFIFNEKEFRDKLPFRTVELDNGAILTAPTSDFNSVFQTEQLEGSESVRYSTDGRIVGQRIATR